MQLDVNHSNPKPFAWKKIIFTRCATLHWVHKLTDSYTKAELIEYGICVIGASN